MRAAYLLSPSFITQGRMGASKAALILIGHYRNYGNFPWFRGIVISPFLIASLNDWTNLI